jgi:hypothetical protein
MDYLRYEELTADSRSTQEDIDITITLITPKGGQVLKQAYIIDTR